VWSYPREGEEAGVATKLPNGKNEVLKYMESGSFCKISDPLALHKPRMLNLFALELQVFKLSHSEVHLKMPCKPNEVSHA
jgi:hypothetical protein